MSGDSAGFHVQEAEVLPRPKEMKLEVAEKF